MIVRGTHHKLYFNSDQCFFMTQEGAMKGPGSVKWMFIVSFIIGILLCLIGAAFMFFGIGPLPVRITMGILGVVLISSSSPIAKAMMN